MSENKTANKFVKKNYLEDKSHISCKRRIKCMRKPTMMIISVGGSISPFIFILNKNRPSFVIFFVSRETQSQVPEILSRIFFKPKGIEQITTPSADKLSECYTILSNKILETLKNWKVKGKQVLVDYTGGTKTMSSALVLATIDLGCKYSYISGTERTKDGIGVVIDGKEKRYILDNVGKLDPTCPPNRSVGG